MIAEKQAQHYCQNLLGSYQVSESIALRLWLIFGKCTCKTVKLKEEDRDGFRYLWRDMDSGAPPRIMRMATLLGTTRYHAEKNKYKFTQAAQIVKDDFYVDNLCSGDIRKRHQMTKSLDYIMIWHSLRLSGVFN